MSAATATATRRKSRTSPTKGPVTPPVVDVQGEANVIRNMLDSYKFEYEYVEKLDISKVNREQSQLNQARIAEPINEDTALLYAIAMEEGKQFPPIVVYQRGREFIVMDGNHRVYAAVDAKLTTFPAYVVKNASPAQITAFTYEANTTHGLPTSLGDRQRQAAFLVDSGRLNQTEAAKALGIRVHALRHFMEGESASRRFTELGNRKYEGITDTARRKLNSIKSNTVLKAVADLYLEARLSAEDLSALIKRVNDPREQREQLAVVERERGNRQAVIKSTASGRLGVPPVLQTLARASSTVQNIDEAKLLTALSEMSDEAREEYARAATTAGSRFIELGMVARRGPITRS